MPPVARFAIFCNLGPEQVSAAEHNLAVRLVPTMQIQPGFVAGVWAALRHPASGFSFACFTTPDAAQAAGVAINAAPLLPEQNPAHIPEPSWVAMGPVLWEHHTTLRSSAVRLDMLASEQNSETTAMIEQLTATIVPHPRVCRAYLVYDRSADRYLLLTLLAGTPASETLDRAFTPDDTLTYDVLLHDVQQRRREDVAAE